jgi:hypothetical protein
MIGDCHWLSQEYQGDTIHQSSGPADLAVTNEYSSGESEVEQLKESEPYKNEETASHNASKIPSLRIYQY